MNQPFLRDGTRTLVRLALLLALLLGGLSGQPAGAQTPDEQPWTDPENLSNSGGATEPRLVIDNLGVLHALWQDETAGTIYTRRSDGAWSEPLSGEYLFDEELPVLVNGEVYLHAFWIARNEDNTLVHSRVLPENFGTPTAWEAPRRISKFVTAFDVTYRGEGRFHLAYVHNLTEPEMERPEGVIYTQSLDEGASWGAETTLYTSRYFRSLNPADANIQIVGASVGEQEIVSASWDNPLLKRVFYARSADGGATWEPPVEVDGPSDDSLSGAPFHITLAAEGREAVRLWQGNLQSGIICLQYYQSSEDGGKTWSERSRMLQNVFGCPRENHLFRMADGSILLETVYDAAVYLLAWNGETWSEPQAQNLLNQFENPLTNDPVIFRCRQPLLAGSNRLYVIGCDEATGGDIWLTDRTIEAVEAWFPEPSEWSQSISITSSEVEIFDVDTLFDPQGRLHILWSQYEPAEKDGDLSGRRSIFYALWDGEEITPPSLVMKSPDNYVDEFALTYDSARNRLALTWNGGNSGEVYFTWSDTERAASALEWPEPVSVPIPRTIGQSPDIHVREDGVIFITYSVAINEGRGVYLVTSADGGETWSQPTPVYTAGNSNWQAVGAPRLALNGDRSTHLIWTQNNVFAEAGALALYYSHADGAAQTWPEPVVTFNQPLNHWWIMHSPEQGLHRFWIGVDETTESIYHDFSLDDGASWSLPGSLTGLGEKPRAVYPFVDARGNMLLAEIIEDDSGKLALKLQNWNGSSWFAADNLSLPDTAEDSVQSLAASAAPAGHVSVIYTTRRVSAGLEPAPWEIVLYNRAAAPLTAPQPTGGAPSAPAGTQPAATPTATRSALVDTPEPTATQAATLAPSETSPPPEPTPTVAQFSTTQTPPPGSATNLGLILAGGIALVVAAAFFTYSRVRRRP